ncbi:MAG: hypothetical protein Q9220_007114 [cf. Caloplaca sp. 1 TL-2023]
MRWNHSLAKSLEQTVAKNQTCQDISNAKLFTNIQLIAWNPTIHASCDNLDSMVGRSICISSSMFPGPYTTGGVTLNSPPASNTTWYNTQTTFRPPGTTTFVPNTTTASLVDARVSLCPLTPDDMLNGKTIYDLPDACAPLLLPYCWPDLDNPAPPSTRFPAICTPQRGMASSTTAAVAPTNAKPAPIVPSTVAGCRTYYKVLDGDNCHSIAKNFKVTLD